MVLFSEKHRKKTWIHFELLIFFVLLETQCTILNLLQASSATRLGSQLRIKNSSCRLFAVSSFSSMTNIFVPNSSEKVTLKIANIHFCMIKNHSKHRIHRPKKVTNKFEDKAFSILQEDPLLKYLLHQLWWKPSLQLWAPKVYLYSSSNLKQSLWGRKWNIERFRKIFHHDASSGQVFNDATSVFNDFGHPTQPLYSILNRMRYD